MAARGRLAAAPGSQVPLAGRRFLDAQDLGGLGVGQVLEVPQGQDLAVERVHPVEGLLEAELPLGADRGLARPADAAQELRGQSRRGRLRQAAAVERDLAAGVAHRRAEVVAGEFEELVPADRCRAATGRTARPGCGGTRAGSGSGRQEDLLNDVGRVDAALERGSSRRPTIRRRRSRCRWSSSPRAGRSLPGRELQEAVRFTRILAHGGRHTSSLRGGPLAGQQFSVFSRRTNSTYRGDVVREEKRRVSCKPKAATRNRVQRGRWGEFGRILASESPSSPCESGHVTPPPGPSPLSPPPARAPPPTTGRGLAPPHTQRRGGGRGDPPQPHDTRREAGTPPPPTGDPAEQKTN